MTVFRALSAAVVAYLYCVYVNLCIDRAADWQGNLRWFLYTLTLLGLVRLALRKEYNRGG